MSIVTWYRVEMSPSRDRRRSKRVAAWDAFAVAAPGLEPIVADELRRLDAPSIAEVPGGVDFKADRSLLYRANLQLRAASRVLVRLAAFRAVSFAELERRARSVPWERVLPVGASVSLRVTCRKSRLYHSGAVAERLLRDLVQRCGAQVRKVSREDEEGAGGQLIIVRLDHDHCVISADSSGSHLHMRGYRTAVTEAPMRETLAAALLLASGWDGRSPLVDPFCGSGTIPIEAAMIAARVSPGLRRGFQFTAWPDFDSVLWDRIRKEAEAAQVPVPPGLIQGSDRSAAAVRAASENAVRAGVAPEFRRLDVQSLVPIGDRPGFVVTNPPYGVRLGDRASQQQLLARFGDILQHRFRGWGVALLVPAERRGPIGGPRLVRQLRTSNGGLPVQILSGRVPGEDSGTT